MKHSLLFAASILAAVCSFAACDDKSSSDESCSNGSYSCQNNTLFVCIGERWNQQMVCENATCSANLKQCVPNGGGDSLDECQSGSYACQNNAISRCDNGHWTVVEACGNKKCSEKDWACVAVPDSEPENPETVTNESCSYNFVEKCDNEVASFCNDDGKVTLRDCKKIGGTCHISKEGGYADCVESCTPSSFMDYATCDGDYVASHLCLEVTDGGYFDYAFTDMKCAEGCDKGRCKQRDTTVVEGGACTSSTCAKGDLYACESGKYVRKPCTGGTVCAMGDTPSCIAKPKKDVECNPSTFIDTCVDNVLYYCHSIDKVVIEFPCAVGIGESCHYVASGQEFVDDGYAECVIPCSEGTEALEQCVKDGDGGYYTENSYCMFGSDGNWWNFPVQTSCSNGCKNGVCL